MKKLFLLSALLCSGATMFVAFGSRSFKFKKEVGGELLKSYFLAKKNSRVAISEPIFIRRDAGFQAFPAQQPFTPSAEKPKRGFFSRGKSEVEKVAEVKKYLEGLSFHGKKFDIRTFKDIFPHLKNKPDFISWYEVFNVPKTANKRMVENAFQLMARSLSGGAFGLKQSATLRTIYEEWKNNVYKDAPYKDLWDKGAVR